MLILFNELYRLKNAISTTYSFINLKSVVFIVCLFVLCKVQVQNAYARGSEGQGLQFKVALNDVSVKSVDLSAVYFEVELLIDNQLDKDLTITKVEYNLDVQSAKINGFINQTEKFLAKQSRRVLVNTSVPHAYSGALVSALLSAKTAAIPYNITGIVFVEELNGEVKYHYKGVYNISDALSSDD